MGLAKLKFDRRGISSFSLLGIVVLLFATFTVTYLSYVTNMDMSYRIKMEELDKMNFKSSEVVQDLENHATYLAHKTADKGDSDQFATEYDVYVQKMASEGFDIWRSGDVTAAIDGIYTAYGGTIGDNYTVELKPVAGGYIVSGKFNVTIRNPRMNIEVSKAIGFEKVVSAQDY